MKKYFAIAAVAALSVSTVAIASVTFDAGTGTGFVGKGDVQLAFGGKNNAWLQNNAAALQFTYNAETVTEVSWNCIKYQTTGNGTVNEIIQERSRTTTSSTTGLVESVGRERNQITGFILNGYDGGGSTSSSTTDGPPLFSCPSTHSTFALDDTGGEPHVVSTVGGLFVSLGTELHQLN